MTELAIDRQSYIAADLVTITKTVSGGTFTMKLTNCHAFVVESNAQPYKPKVLSVHELISHQAGDSRCTFSVMAKGPYTYTLGSSTVHVVSFWELLSAIDLAGASVTIVTRSLPAGTLGIYAADNETLLTGGTIVQVTNAGPASITIEIEQAAEIEFAQIPERVVDDTLAANDAEKKLIPNASKGQAIPAIFGALGGSILPWTDLPSTYFEDGTDFQNLAALFGLDVCNVSPCVRVQNGGSTYRYAFLEKATNGLDLSELSAFSTKHEPQLYLHLSEIDSLARLYGNNSGLEWSMDAYDAPWNGKAFTAVVRKIPWIQATLVPEYVETGLSGGSTGTITNPAHATDGKIDTWTKIAAGSVMRLSIPKVSPIGRIAANSNDQSLPNPINSHTDQEVDNPAPAGLRVIVVYGAPAGETLTAGSLRMGVQFPKSGKWLFSDGSFNGYTDFPLPTTVGQLRVSEFLLPYLRTGKVIGADDSGWAGTKFHNWNFTSAAYDGGEDNSIHDPADGTGEGAFRIALQAITGAAYIVSVVFVVGCKYGIRAYQPASKVDPRWWGPDNDRARVLVGPYDDLEQLDQQNKQNAWDRSRGNRARLYSGQSLDNVYYAGPGYMDTPTGTLTGFSNQLVENPADLLHGLVRYWGKQTSINTTANTPGELSYARGTLNAWAQYHGGGSASFKFSLPASERVRVNELKAAIEELLPGSIVRKNRLGQWSLFLWHPGLSRYTNVDYRPTASGFNPTRIDPRDVCIQTDGIYAIQLQQRDRSGICNEVEVRYDWDARRNTFRRSALATAQSSSDGRGGTWPLTPGTGLTAESLCAFSQAEYDDNRGPRRRTIDAPWVRDTSTAVAIGCYNLWRDYRPEWSLQMTGLPKLHDMEPGLVFNLSDAGMVAIGCAKPPRGLATDGKWGTTYWMCTSAEMEGPEGNRLCTVSAVSVPVLVGDEVSAGSGGEIPTDDPLLLGVL